MEKVTNEQFKRAIYPKENKRFILAMAVGIPIAILGIIATISTFGLILLFIAALVFMAWFSLSIAKMSLIGNSIRVSSNNFPEIFEIYKEVKEELSYEKEIQIYIVNDGDVNALLAKFFRTKFIVLNSGLVSNMIENKESLNQMKWIIARFIGALQAKHFKTTILRLVFDSIEKIKIFNFFLLPYERATQYTGDNIGMLVSKDVRQTFHAFNKFMIGNELSNEIKFEGIFEQGNVIYFNDLFSFLARAFSSHPHLVNRYLNMLAYAKKEFPDQFANYLEDFDLLTQRHISRLLPKYA